MAQLVEHVILDFGGLGFEPHVWWRDYLKIKPLTKSNICKVTMMYQILHKGESYTNIKKTKELRTVLLTPSCGCKFHVSLKSYSINVSQWYGLYGTLHLATNAYVPFSY